MGFRMSRLGGVVCILSFCIALPVLADDAQVGSQFIVTSPPSPIGSGARAMGQAGAFIATADDATASSWNPGALVHLEHPEASAVGTYDVRQMGDLKTNFGSINYMSASYPFHISDYNMIFALNYQRVYDMWGSRDFGADIQSNDQNSPPLAEIMLQDWGPDHHPIGHIFNAGFSSKLNGTFRQQGTLGALTPAFAISITPKFSVGAAANMYFKGFPNTDYEQTYKEKQKGKWQQVDTWYYDSNGDCQCFKNPEHSSSGPCGEFEEIVDPACLDAVVPVDEAPGGVNPVVSAEHAFASSIRQKETREMEGQNMTLGFLWEMAPRFTLGGVYRSEMHAKFDRTRWIDFEQGSDDPELVIAPTHLKFHYAETLITPASYGLGLSFRYSDALTFALDVSRIEYDRFLINPQHGARYSVINGISKSRADIDPVINARLGGEYIIITDKAAIPVRAGYFYDPQPRRGGMDNFMGFTLGGGVATNKFAADLAYYYRFCNDAVVNERLSADRRHVLDTYKDYVGQHMIMFSLIAYFD